VITLRESVLTTRGTGNHEAVGMSDPDGMERVITMAWRARLTGSVSEYAVF
jgi:hypothetical protein